ncbi:MAG: hypothetical protein NC399_00280 [Muribaculum sp.]|nr:hypothetical protein [Muribaculum sp.]
MKGGERIFHLLENLPDHMLEEAWKIEKVQIGKRRKALCGIAAAACLVILFMTFVPAGQAMAAQIRESIEYLLEQWFPPKEIPVHPEGEQENITHEIYGDLPEPSESMAQETERVPEAGFAIYIDPEMFETATEGEDYLIRQKRFIYTREDAVTDIPTLLAGLSEEEAERKILERMEEMQNFYDSMPICEIRITQIPQTTPENASVKMREDFEETYENVSDITKSSLLDGLYLYGNMGTQADSEVVEIYFVDNGLGGVFVIKAVYYTEAAEGMGARFHTMIETFEVLLKKEETPASTTAKNNPYSADAQKIEGIITEFCAAYFEGDLDSIKSFLTDPYIWDVNVYENSADKVKVMAVKGLEDIGEKNIDDVCVVSVEYKEDGMDAYVYLTVELIKTDKGWKIEFYGNEG